MKLTAVLLLPLLLLLLGSLAAVLGAVPAAEVAQNGTCGEVPGADIQQPSLSIIHGVDSAGACCQICLLSQPCQGYTWHQPSRDCHIKANSTMTYTKDSALTSGAKSAPRPSGPPISVSELGAASPGPAAPPEQQAAGTNGACQFLDNRYLGDTQEYTGDCAVAYLESKLNIGSAQDCCALCLANPKCNMFDWCDPAKVEKAGSSECFPEGVSGECALWQTSKATTTVRYCTDRDGPTVTWRSGIIEGRDPSEGTKLP